MLACGVAYNAMRIALSERARELSTLRVLGLTHREISYILFGEIGLLAWLGLPIGCGVGIMLSRTIAGGFETELLRIPTVIERATFGVAILVTTVAVMGSAILVRRRLGRLDLIAVLKTRE
jgi:putative ABC transport system permease protein